MPLGSFRLTTLARIIQQGLTESYWISSLSTDIVIDGLKVRKTSTDEIISAGNVGTTLANRVLFVTKHDTQGELVWQKSLNSTAASTEKLIDLAVDSSDNIYIFSDVGSNAKLIKFNSDLSSKLWEKSWTSNENGSIAIDSSDNVIVCTNVADGTDYSFTKFDSSGTNIWQRTTNLSGVVTATLNATTILNSGEGNIVTVGRVPVGAAYYGRVFSITNSATPSVSHARSYYYNGSTDQTEFFNVVYDSSGNIYCIGIALNAAATDFRPVILKLDSSYAIVWERQIDFASTDSTGVTGTIDSEGNIYIVYSGGFGAAGINISKMAADGTLTWVRNFKHSSLGLVRRFITVDSNDNLIISASLSSTPGQNLLIKLPSDGSLTGTYGSYIYSTPTSPTINSNTLTTATTTPGLVTATYSNSTADPTTASTSSYSSSLTNIS
jgi:hypothetical protein